MAEAFKSELWKNLFENVWAIKKPAWHYSDLTVVTAKGCLRKIESLYRYELLENTTVNTEFFTTTDV